MSEKTLVPLLYADGKPFRGPNGGVLVEVLSSALPAGAATEETLLELDDELVSIRESESQLALYAIIAEEDCRWLM